MLRSNVVAAVPLVVAVVVVVVVGVGGGLASACVFEPTVPPGAQVRCADNADCPVPLQCDRGSLRCVEAGADITPPAITDVHFEPAFARAGTAGLVLIAADALPPALGA